jgi:hypothetical protein
MNLVFEYPAWLSVFCALAGVSYSLLLYRNDKRTADFSRIVKTMLFGLRAVVVFFIALFLLSPLLRHIKREVEKPIIIVAQDNSESIIANKDSAYYKNEYKKSLVAFTEKLKGKYEVRSFSFADKVSDVEHFDSLSFNEKQTNMADLFEQLQAKFSNRNIGALIVASDGIYNKGANPLYLPSLFNAPIYTIALGDTNAKMDAAIYKVEHNQFAYLGNKFPMQIVVQAQKLKQKKATLTIKKNDNLVYTQEIIFTNDAYTQSFEALLNASEIGIQRYKVELSYLPEEFNKRNNTKEVLIEILDARQKILLLASAPHPDVAAIKNTLDENQNYEASLFMLDDFKDNLSKYNLVIVFAHSANNTTAGRLLNELKSKNIPFFIFTGAGNVFKNDLSIISVNKTNDVEPAIDKNFALFTISNELIKSTTKLPTVNSAYINNMNESGGNTLFYQRIGIVETKIPLLTFKNYNELKYAVFNGEGIWRWKMQNYAQMGNHQVFAELISKTIQYLSAKEDKSFFRINAPSHFWENENVMFDAEVYNQSYELITEPEVSINIINAEKNKFPYTFSPSSNGYRLNAGMMPVGEYKYQAQVKVGDKIYTKQGTFSVLPLQVEYTNTTANHQLLYTLSQKNNAQLFYPTQLDTLAQTLISREDIKPISYSEKAFDDLINLDWILYLLIALLGLEWFLRKRNGTY